jgi:hypothetical protein
VRILADIAEQRKEYLRCVTASQGNDLRLITVEEIVYFQADHKYTMIVPPPCSGRCSGSKPGDEHGDKPIATPESGRGRRGMRGGFDVLLRYSIRAGQPTGRRDPHRGDRN